jgi:hypothetical protein
MLDVRWTGREGEKIFSLLCSRRQVTCNKAEEDDRGWDFIINFPPPPIAKVPIDQRSVGATALVQIKATHVEAQRWSISLKNALSLARSPLPAFIVCVGIGPNGEETFRAIHLWNLEIARILKAARQANVEKDEAINRRTISFDFDEQTTRSDVLGWMRAQVDEIGETRYAAAKQLLIDTLGFDEGHGIGHVTFSTASPDALADLQLGILTRLDIDRFSYTPRRFGIDSPEPEMVIEGGTLELVPQGRQGTIRLRAANGEQEFLPAEVFSAALPGTRRLKGRIKADWLDMVIKPHGRTSAKCRLLRDKVSSLESIAGYALLRQSSRASRLLISVKTTGPYGDLGFLNMKPNMDEGWSQLYFITQALRALVTYENADPLHTSLEAINAQFVPLSVVDALVASRALRLEFTPVETRAGEIGAFLAYTSVAFGDHEVGAVASRPVVKDRMIGSRRHIDFGPATVHHASVNDGCAVNMRERYLDLLDEMSETLDVLAFGDLQRSASREEERELVIDTPRQTPRRLLTASA